MRYPAIIGALVGILTFPGESAAQTLRSYGTEEAFAAHRRQMVRDWRDWIRRHPPYGSHPLPRDPGSPYTPVPPGEPVDSEARAPVHAGGLVKSVGEQVLVLHREHLYALRLAADGMEMVDVAPLAPGDGTFREILVSGRTVIAVGSDAAGTMADLMDLGDDGRLRPRGRYQIRLRPVSTDERMLGARLVDGRLVFYSAARSNPDGETLTVPGIEYRGRGDSAWISLTSPTTIYRAPDPPRVDESVTLHTLVSCDPRAAAMTCRATSVYGAPRVAYHLSGSALYVWTLGGSNRDGRAPAATTIYRLPVDGGPPTAVATERTIPVDEHAFRERDRALEVLVRGPQLLRIPLDSFGDGRTPLAPAGYRAVGGRDAEETAARFASEWAIWGLRPRPYDNYTPSRDVFAARVQGDTSTVHIPLRRDFERLAPFGEDGALLVSAAGDSMAVQVLRLSDSVEVGEALAVRKHEAMLLTHDSGEPRGVTALGLPGFGDEARVLFLRREGLQLTHMGAIAGPACGASCGYTMVRPFWVGGRTFTLLGGDVIELRDSQGTVRQAARLRLEPRPAAAEARPADGR